MAQLERPVKQWSE
ncbi:unnamed protein product [Acanthoscelides obtectus]|uniref:Uncharacterized protein n=1 Tax=Acanthoscelides obtectus TaxID=200917 RepID=A0A9P0LDF0_ACAOB|nr:unnamed protein product [Acanthoscelides obtectus]CAK1621805.1 hypothetical protein AOBTE_LOCUS1139 [Acanthoscelides obtectus]